MKIIHLLPSLNLFGGTPRKTKLLIENSRNDHAIYCWSAWEGEQEFKKFKSDFEESKIKIFDRSSIKGIKSVFFHVLELKKICKKEEVHVIQTYFDKGIIIAAISVLFNRKIKLVVSFVGSSSGGNPLINLVLSFLIRRANSFIYISEYVYREKLKKFSYLGKVSRNIIFNGTEFPARIRNYKESFKRNISLLTISGINEFKNLFLLIRVAEKIRQRKEINFIINIIGDGPLKKTLQEEINKLKLQDHIKILGYKENVMPFLDDSDIYLHPADKEGFGIAVVEAMMRGVPVVCSNAGALPELIINNSTGLLAGSNNELEWADKIIGLSKSEVLYNSLSLNGMEHAKIAFNIKQFALSHDNLYEGLIDIE
tara:strand:+ start:1341 stop:2447 length:1107 start_codon:yes stop_codon:yes gene_type:complete